MAQRTKAKAPTYTTEQKRICVTSEKGMLYRDVLYAHGYVLDYVGPWPISEHVAVEVGEDTPAGPPISEAEKMMDPAYAKAKQQEPPPIHTTDGFVRRQYERREGDRG